jgi:hypothetical protein
MSDCGPWYAYSRRCYNNSLTNPRAIKLSQATRLEHVKTPVLATHSTQLNLCQPHAHCLARAAWLRGHRAPVRRASKRPFNRYNFHARGVRPRESRQAPHRPVADQTSVPRLRLRRSERDIQTGRVGVRPQPLGGCGDCACTQQTSRLSK